MTEKEAIELGATKFWETMSYRDRAMFQMFEERLCMPFEIFHEAVEEALGRPAFIHEFGLSYDALRAELLGDRPTPTLEEIAALIPAHKRVIMKL